MSKEYRFEFCGTKEDLISKINTVFACSHALHFYCNKDYIIEIVDGEIHFGVERGGHSGGYWYVPTVSEYDGKTELCGKIRYIGPEDDRSRIWKALDRIGVALWFIFLLPVFLVFWLYAVMESAIRKICKLPKRKTTEDKLLDLMETHLGCVQKRKPRTERR